MDEIEQETLEEWAKVFGGTAILGFISTLLIGGKCVHHIFQRRGLVFGIFIIPPAIISGLLGLLWFIPMEYMEPVLTSDLRIGLDSIKANLINFVFAALILGLTCGRTYSQHNSSFRGIATSILHEGMPMIIYSQILQWGQSVCCLSVLCILNYFNASIPSLFPAMIPLGIEAGSDNLIAFKYRSFWSEPIVQEAESLGLIVTCIVGILMFTFKPYFISKGWLGAEYLRGSGQSSQGDNTVNSGAVHTTLRQGTGQAEAFERSSGTIELRSLGKLNRSWSSDNIHDSSASYKKETPRNSNYSPKSSPSDIYRKQFPNYSSNNNTEVEIDYMTEEFTDEDDPHTPSPRNRIVGYASLGSHLSLIALTVFLAFGFSLICHIVEDYYSLKHHMLSGVRMFKLSMCCALISMVLILQKSNIRFNRDWFMRLCGLMLDLLFIAALAKSYPKPHDLEPTHYLICSIFVLICLLWNMFCFVFVAKHLFPNYWFERALTLSGDSMGHCYTGLLFARTLDPSMESPVPAAYAYKLMLFFIPSSGAKNTIVVMLASRHGIFLAWIVCMCVGITWILIFLTHFKHKYVSSAATIPSTKTISDAIEMKNKSIMQENNLSAHNSMLDLKHPGHISDSEPLLNHSSSESLDLCDDDAGTVTPPAKNKLISQLDLESGNGKNSPAVRRTSYATNNSSLSLNTNNTAVSDFPLIQSHKYVTKVTSSEPSSILSSEQMSMVASFLSDSKASKMWKLAYSLRQHGASLSTLLSMTSKFNTYRHGNTQRIHNAPAPCIIVIEDSWGYIFGGFISPGLQNKKGYYGTGESFVFSVVPTPQVYKWTGSNELFVLSNEKCFAMGGGGDGFALQLDDELDTGVSNRSATFGNSTLSSNEFFKCLNVEVWVLELAGGFSV